MADNDILFVAITRPTMKMGVPIEGLIVNAAVTWFAFVWASHGGNHIIRMLMMLLIFPLIHFPMRIMASMDHNMFRIGRLWLQRGIALRTADWNGELLPALPHHPPSSPRDISASV